jgi:hypothetical protein
MNLDRSRILLSKLHIKDRDKNISVPFKFNPNQIKAFNVIKHHYAQYGSIRVIILKARRVGMSSLMDSLLFCHCLARPQSHSEIVAHLKEISEKGLFRVPRDLGEELNAKIECCDVRARDIIFHHTDGDSRMDIATAGSVGGGRGLTLTALHLSEAAQYPGANSFLGILPAVSKAPDTIIALESTAFGRVGLGQTFYEFWLRSNRKGRDWSGYTPVFLSWLDDPACYIDEEAEDAPATDLERELMKKPYNATPQQISWMRRVLESECDASESLFAQEYPWDPQVAFVSTGDPAFTPQEINFARGTVKLPLATGHLERSSDSTFNFTETHNGKLLIWEKPQPKCWYFIGGDCARGMDEATGRATGDFASYIVINGSTGKLAARFADWVNPEQIAEDLDKAGRWYNNAMVNIELTGNLGLWAQKLMRDRYYYPNLYVWRGKDDAKAGKEKRHSLGWETTARTRDLLLSTFRGKLREGMKAIPGGFKPIDRELVDQMDNCSMSAGLRWEVRHGHDDILMACLLAVISCAQYPPPNIASTPGNYMETKEERQAHIAQALRPQASLERALRADLKYIMFKTNKLKNHNVMGLLP